MNYIQLTIFFFIGICCPSILAQKNSIPNNLQEQLNQTKNDSIKLVYLTEFVQQINRDQPNQIIPILEHGLYISKKNLNSQWGKTSYRFLAFKLAHIYRQERIFNSSIATFKAIIQTGLSLDETEMVSDGYSDLAYTFADQDQNDSATIYDLKALALREENNSPKTGGSYNNLGFDYKLQKDLDKALFYYQKAVAYKLEKGQEDRLGNTYINIGNIYQTKEGWDSAFHYYNKTLICAVQIKDSLFIGEVLHSIGRTHSLNSNFKEAQGYFEKAMQIFQLIQFDQHPRVVATYQELANVLLKLKDLKGAENLLTKAENILIANGMNVSYDMERNLHFFEQFHWQNENFEQARIYTHRGFALKDSLHQSVLDQKVYQVLAKYEDQLKQQRIAALEQQQQIFLLENDKMRRQQLFLGLVAFLMVLVIGILYRVNKWRSQVNKELETLNNTKDKLFSIIAHDLKNPLSAFRSITQSLSDDLFSIDKEDLAYFIKQLNQSANSLFDLLQNLLYWSISQSGLLDFKPQNMKLSDNIQKVIDLLMHSAVIKNIKIEHQVAETLMVFTDQKMLHTVLRNLIANAIKFTPNDGTICIQASKQASHTTLSVSDTGIGMSTELMNSLFKLKQTSSNRDEIKGKGTGLGLVLCKELVERQNGNIWVESNPNQGSTFTFTLPSA